MPSEHITLSTINQRFAWNLRVARRRAGLTQQELADRLGGSQAQVSGWEDGRSSVRIDSIVRLAEALEIDPGVLLRETKGLTG
jgi:transcriptional regulator with XRE-family HTH domain